MWITSGKDITMTEGDYGIQLPIVITGTTFTASDELLLTVKSQMNGETLLTKQFTNITENTVNLELTATESADLKVGTYMYSLDWFQSGVFLCNIIPNSIFRVVDKA